MAKVAITKSKMDSLANSIAAKSGVPVTMTVDEMKTAVDSILVPSGSIAITQSGTTDVTDYASATVAAGTEGVPTATKGTVSNHSVAVTPSVTNTAGYITGSTKTGTAVTVSASELVSGSQTIIENDTYDVTNLASVTVNVEGEPGGARIVDTPDAGGGTVRTITTGEETSLTTKTVTPNDEPQYVVGDTELFRITKTIAAESHVDQGTNTSASFSQTPDVILTVGQRYRIIGIINVIDSGNVILDTYNIDTIFTLSTGATSIFNGDSDSYFYYFRIYKSGSNISIQYCYKKTATYGLDFHCSIYEITEYDGLLQVTVNPVPDTYYRPDLIKNMIERDTSFKTFNFPDGITSIGSYAFTNCQYLALTSLPSNITLINTYAFYNCSRLALTSLPSGLTTIYGYVFYNCSRLALTSLPSGVTAINDYAFYCCTSLALTSLPSGVTSIGNSAFNGCTSLALTSLPSGITSIGSSIFFGCTSLALTSLPSGVTSIGGTAFRNCTSLTITSLPSGVTSIQNGAFQGCTGLTTISCTGIITTLGGNAFSGDSTHHMQLEEVYFPNMALTSNLSTVFGNSTAANACQELEICDIGITTGITSNAFANCYKLQTLILRKTSVCTLASVTAFTNTPFTGYNGLTATVYVPSGLISSYQTASNWSSLYATGNVTFSAIEGSNYELD